ESIRHSPKSETLAKLLKVIVLGNLVTPTLQVHTRITYHRTWETGLEVAARAAITNPDFFARILPLPRDWSMIPAQKGLWSFLQVPLPAGPVLASCLKRW